MQGTSWSSSSVRFNCHLKCCITAIYSPDSSSTSTYQSSPDFFQFCNKVPPFDLHNSNHSPQFIFQTSALCFFSPSRSNAPVQGTCFVSTAYSLELLKFYFVCLNSAYQLECLVICCHNLQTIDLGVIQISSTCEHIMS